MDVDPGTKLLRVDENSPEVGWKTHVYDRGGVAMYDPNGRLMHTINLSGAYSGWPKAKPQQPIPVYVYKETVIVPPTEQMIKDASTAVLDMLATKPRALTDYLSGNAGAINALMGLIMKRRCNVNPKVVKEQLEIELAKLKT